MSCPFFGGKTLRGAVGFAAGRTNGRFFVRCLHTKNLDCDWLAVTSNIHPLCCRCSYDQQLGWDYCEKNHWENHRFIPVPIVHAKSVVLPKSSQFPWPAIIVARQPFRWTPWPRRGTTRGWYRCGKEIAGNRPKNVWNLVILPKVVFNYRSLRDKSSEKVRLYNLVDCVMGITHYPVVN